MSSTHVTSGRPGPTTWELWCCLDVSVNWLQSAPSPSTSHSPSANTKVRPLTLLFFSRPRSEGWLFHARTFFIYLCPVSFWLTLPRGVLSTSWCCPSRPCVAFLAFVHLVLFLALPLYPDNSLVSSLCDYSMLASLLWRCLTVAS